MSTKSTQTSLMTTIGAAFVSSLSATATIAADNPFSMQQLDSGYVYMAEVKSAEDKSAEGSCGELVGPDDAKGCF